MSITIFFMLSFSLSIENGTDTFSSNSVNYTTKYDTWVQEAEFRTIWIAHDVAIHPGRVAITLYSIGRLTGTQGYVRGKHSIDFLNSSVVPVNV